MDSQMKPARIEFSSAALTVAERRILSDVSVDLTAPRIGIIGRNGSGKTSFARLLSGLVKPSEGTVRIDGLDPAKDRRAALSLVGILFQNPDHQLIFPTVVEELAFGLRQLGLDDPEAAARAQLDRFGKSHWAESHVHGLSQGQKQLVCLMAVLAMAPRILVLDEPFAGLDIPTRMQLGRYLDRYEGTLVHVTHDPDELTSYDHVLWIEAGKLEQQGLPADVLPAFTAQMEQKGESDDISDLSD